ncbi:MAG: aminomethyl-transferring glycine dehydrogenase, partial [Clostridia bacterium]|nr:aminomethyl-transferring glycine dehydrogenase [Clostridia bacterium]
MGNYLPSSRDERLKMAREIGLGSPRDLFSDVPDEIKLDDPKQGGRCLKLDGGKSEYEVLRRMKELAEENTVFMSIFRGAGAYNHFIPSAVKSITSKDEFVTAYTPYQAELSQGILQSIFEFQSMICRLTDLDCASASVYDGATAAAEALSMCRERSRTTALVSATTNPHNLRVMKTYSNGAGVKLVTVPEKDGKTDVDALNKLISEYSDTVSCVYIETPNYYGIIEDVPAVENAAHIAGAKLVIGANPIYLAVGKTPGEYNADIAVGEGQPLGMPMAFGGP